jgi:cell division protein FtsB
VGRELVRRQGKRLKLFDADRISALATRCTEQRERAEKAEARIEVLERENTSLRKQVDILRGNWPMMADDATLAAEEKRP